MPSGQTMRPRGAAVNRADDSATGLRGRRIGSRATVPAKAGSDRRRPRLGGRQQRPTVARGCALGFYVEL